MRYLLLNTSCRKVIKSDHLPSPVIYRIWLYHQINKTKEVSLTWNFFLRHKIAISNISPALKGKSSCSLSSLPHPPCLVFRTTTCPPNRGLKWRAMSSPAMRFTWNLQRDETNSPRLMRIGWTSSWRSYICNDPLESSPSLNEYRTCLAAGKTRRFGAGKLWVA